MERHQDSSKSNPELGESVKPGRHLASGRTALHFPSAGSTRLRQHGLSARGILATRRHEMSHAIVEVCLSAFLYLRKMLNYGNQWVGTIFGKTFYYQCKDSGRKFQ
ncbi:hypothetical protein CVT25_004352 [Psilocybe cyanescens]|uniref:Uncharacterized protein n=1 Tax=Psilocybe cyanescens TaxID=93625 RepID=A0A409XQ72_PSICY|nr:hypothetical protein CVT25_004352 [Psilocybe cyanescens]